VDARAATFSIGEVAAMVGMSPHTIRAWERRYRVVSPGRTQSNQRRYTSEDLETLIRVKQAVTARPLSLRLAAVEQADGIVPEALVSQPEVDEPPPSDYEPDLWRLAADVLPNLMLLLDTRGRIVDTNIAVVRATGILRSRLRGFRFAEMVDPHDRARAVKVYRSPGPERRGWALNLKAAKLVGFFAFDFQTVALGAHRLIVAVGHRLNDNPAPRTAA
jgi:PAS domain-containing protein